MSEESRACLLALGQAAAASVARLELDLSRMVEASQSSNADDEHDPEGATIAFERQLLAAQLEQARSDLAQAQAAVGRLDAGEYGRCESCGEPIGAGRLQVRPVARTCIECAAMTGPRRG